jgi:SAM-dependent methyltransferase
LGCGPNPKCIFDCKEIWGIDVVDYQSPRIKIADLAIEPIPFENEEFDIVTAYDFIEHIPRVIYCPQRRNSFVELMNEVYRVLKPGGIFYSFTPAFPASAAFRDPEHVNIITEETFPLYFDNNHTWAKGYGFRGKFKIESQNWHQNQIHLITIMRRE